MQIILTTFNARYSHTAMGLRCLRANLGDLREQSAIVEFDNSVTPQVAAEQLLARNPNILLFSVYIWNLNITSETVAILRALRPELMILIGGPEVSHDYEHLALFKNANHLICGEGEGLIEQICKELLGSDTTPPTSLPADSSVPQASCLPRFNPLQSVEQSRRKNLPHWRQAQSTYFVTFRLADSIAKTNRDEYTALRKKWLEHNDTEMKTSPNQLFSEKVNNWLDQGTGSCILRELDNARIVADTLLHFAGERYVLDEWVIMPNHVHVLVTPLPGFELSSILHSWKSFSAQKINKHIGQSGTVWKQESYDHIVRNQEELVRIRHYIRNNPAKAGITAPQGRLEACDTTPPASLPADSPVPQASCLPKVIDAPPADLARVALPYGEYTDEDIANRRIYIESSRGCPFSCDYCLSSLENGVRTVPPQRLLPMVGKLIERGARIFKFIDRSFNACPQHAEEILNFFIENRTDGMMLHLEWEPHLLPDNLEQILQTAPTGFFQLETGLQTFNPDVAKRIRRRLDPKTAEKNIRRLSSVPSVHLHADLIAGLPGETLQSLAEGFDRLHACGPHEIQLGILKKLRGAPIVRHDAAFGMVYNSVPPYDILQTSTMTFAELQTVRRFARFWNITINNGRFPNSAPQIWADQPSVFYAFMEWTQWLYQQTNSTAGFAATRLGSLLAQFLVKKRGLSTQGATQIIDEDLNRFASAKKGAERQARHAQ